MIKILKASAGTGKTYRLSLEYVAALLKGINFSEIVVMTFTRKATAEIREKILEHIEDITVNGEKSEAFLSLKKVYKDLDVDSKKLQKNYEKMLQNKDKINIFTIDSFINQIFKKAIAPYLGVHSYEIVEENKNTEIIENVFKTILDNQKDFLMMEKFLMNNPEKDIEKYLNLIKKILDDRWKFLLIKPQKRAKKVTGNLVDSFDTSLDYLKAIVEEKGKEFSKEYFKKDFQDTLFYYLNLESEEEKKELLLKEYKGLLRDNFWNGNKVRGKKVADLREELELSFEKFREDLAKYIYNTEMIPYEEEVLNFCNRIYEIYDEIKFKEKIFTHTDISNYTYKYLYHEDLNLLEEDSVSEYFYELIGVKVKSLFIDEFQDTSILQWKILKPLINKCENVIAVGDEKQSIYGWRGGEKDLFVKLPEILSGESESLEICYRSQKEIIDFFNSFFENLEISWEYRPVKNEPKKTGGYVEVLLGGKRALESEVEIDVKENLKSEIAQDIKNKLKSFKGVGILARSNSELSEIAEELSKENIPYILESKDSLLDHKAIKPLYFLLDYLVYNEYLSLLKFLRSDLVGVNNSVLKYLLLNKSKVEKYLLGEEKNLELLDLEKVLAKIKLLKNMPYEELVEFIFENSGVLRIYQEDKNALQNIYAFFRKMKEFTSLSDFLKYLKENRESEELKQVGITEENAVNLMTIHKAKGLSFKSEFFYWDPRTMIQRSRGSGLEFFISFDANFENTVDYLITDLKYTPLFPYLDFDFYEKEKEKRLMEEINNVYVALTRAVENLFFYIETPKKLKPDKNGMFWSDNDSYGFFENALTKACKCSSLIDLLERKTFGKLNRSEKKEEVEEISLPDLKEYFKVSQIPEEKLQKIKEKYYDHTMDLNLEFAVLEGLAIHYYLEHIKYNTPEEKRLAKSMILSRYGNILGTTKTREILNRVEKFIEKNEKYFSRKWTVFTEYEIQSETETFRIDRLLVDKESKKILVLDFKTGSTKEKEQLENYLKIIKNKTGDEYEVQGEFLTV